jgi:hypothetical protein
MITSGLWIREHAGVAWGWSGWRPTRTTYRRWLLPMTHLTAYLSPDDRTEAEAVRRHLCQLLFDLYPSHAYVRFEQAEINGSGHVEYSRAALAE